MTLDKYYIPKRIEEHWCNIWDKMGYFNIKYDYSVKDNNYCIMIPPPNITGDMHLGHAMQHAIMDIIIRYRRMQGMNVFWKMGLDHAGIATQILINNVVLKKYKSSNFKKDFYFDQAWKLKDKTSKKIEYQMKRIGDSINYKDNCFTMDKRISQAVNKVFIKMYKDNLIYRSKRLVNWDCKLTTAISDIEVKNKKLKGFIWYIKYPLLNLENEISKDYILVATTRPETILGDSGIAVHPDDHRYNHLIGKEVIIPIVDVRIPIIGDRYVDIDKGTGCLKITPAHDFNDFNIGKRHGLNMINIFTLDGRIREIPEIFDHLGNLCNKINRCIPNDLIGLDRYDARKIIVSKLKKLGLLLHKKLHEYQVPYNYRNDSIIEPMLLNQWYVKTDVLSKIAIKIVKNGKINFIPKNYENIYFSWMNNIQDWCVSRSLWWGHRIPVWYDEKENIYVGYNEKDVRKKYKIKKDISLHQDKDVLDTWFSSGIWSFASLGWPKNIKFLEKIHPFDLVVSGFDIIFFWIARMIMLTSYVFKDKDDNITIPFKKIFITGLIYDENGIKMSKSKGNTIDPIDIIDGISLSELIKKRLKGLPQDLDIINNTIESTKKYFSMGIKPYGADTLRLALSSISYNTRKIVMDSVRFQKYYNFCNKLWQVSRFVIMKVDSSLYKNLKRFRSLSLADKWIFYEVNRTIELLKKYLNQYRIDLAIDAIYDFIWNKFCNWYIEISKFMLKEENQNLNTKYTLISILELILRFSHPFIPFITETIWQEIKYILGYNNNQSTIMFQPFPKYKEKFINKTILQNFTLIKDIVVFIRKMFIKNKINKNLAILLQSNNLINMNVIKNNLILISKLTKIKIYTSAINNKNNSVITENFNGINITLLNN